MQLARLHHVTCVCADAQRTLEFYRDELGFSLVKKTVNFDDPHSYHLYFGDQVGSPGTLITFFEWPRAELGRKNARQRIDGTAGRERDDDLDGIGGVRGSGKQRGNERSEQAFHEASRIVLVLMLPLNHQRGEIVTPSNSSASRARVPRVVSPGSASRAKKP